MSRSLAVVSVPSIRTARFLVSSRAFARIRERHDVLIMSPFHAPAFKQEFGGERVRFFDFDVRELASGRLWARAYGASEMLRFVGYYRRFRNTGLRLQESMWVTWIYGRNGDDRRRSLRQRVILRALGVLGRHRKAWRTFDRLAGSWFYSVPLARLRRETDGYDHVVVLHGANFGEQERFLNYAARRLGFRQVLVPYTTDQLSVNGYVIGDYAHVLAQGPCETDFAHRIQRVPEKNVASIGSIWFRNIEASLERQGLRRPPSAGRDTTRILYVGHSSLYFPRSNEFAALDALLAAMASGALPAGHLTYRPLLDEPQELAEIQARYGSNPRVSVQVPQSACIGMTEFDGPAISDQIDEYVRQLAETDIVVMSQVTTLCFDSLLIGRPVVSNVTDFTGTLARRRYSDYLDDDIYGLRRAGLPVVSSLPELIDTVAAVVSGNRDVTAFRDAALRDWDYAPPDWVERLMATLEPPGTAAATTARPLQAASGLPDTYTPRT